jgi:hypothetical protein
MLDGTAARGERHMSTTVDLKRKLQRPVPYATPVADKARAWASERHVFLIDDFIEHMYGVRPLGHKRGNSLLSKARKTIKRSLQGSFVHEGGGHYRRTGGV